jgi:hypothetical protein
MALFDQILNSEQMRPEETKFRSSRRKADQALRHALEDGCLEEAKLAFESGASPDAVMDAWGRRPLHLALETRKIAVDSSVRAELVRLVLSQKPKTLNVRVDGEGFLARAIYCRLPWEILEILIEARPELLGETNSRGVNAALFKALFYEDIPLARKLAERGVPVVEAPDQENRMLPYFVYLGKFQTVRFLVEEAGFDPSLPGRFGSTPLDIAEKKQMAEMERWLRAHGAESAKDADSLAYAAYKGNLEKAREILSSGKVHPDAPGRYGSTGLMNAAKRNDVAMVALFLSYGADPQLKHPTSHRSAITLARSPEVKELLLAKVDRQQVASALGLNPAPRVRPGRPGVAQVVPPSGPVSLADPVPETGEDEEDMMIL